MINIFSLAWRNFFSLKFLKLGKFENIKEVELCSIWKAELKIFYYPHTNNSGFNETSHPLLFTYFHYPNIYI